MDITTTSRSGGRVNGTTRVEQSLARELKGALGHRLEFCTCNTSGFHEAPFPRNDELSSRSRRNQTPGAKKAKSNRFDRRLERLVRHSLRSGWRRFASQTARNPFPAAVRGDCLFLPGETWGPRYDYDLLTSLRSQHGLRVAALCQDLIPVTDPQFFESERFTARFREYVTYLLTSTDLIIAISESTARELEKLRPNSRPSPPIKIIQLGSDFNRPAPSPPAIASRLNGRPFALSVSTIQARKNFDLIYRVWRRLSLDRPDECPRLVIVGQRGFGSEDLLGQISRDPAVADIIFILHDASDPELAWLYDHCRFTLYPSFAEGWGLPISESLAYGRVCVAANTTSMPEAAQNLCVLLDPIDTMGWYDAVVSLIEEPDRVDRLEAGIKERYRSRSWMEAAQDIASALDNLTVSENFHGL